MKISPVRVNGAAILAYRGGAAGGRRGRGREHGAAAGPLLVGPDRPPAPGVGGQRTGHGRHAVLLHAAYARGLPLRHGRPHGLHQRGRRRARLRRHHRRPGTILKLNFTL